MANSTIISNNRSLYPIKLLNGQSDVESFLVSVINCENVTFGLAVISNDSKNDVITNLANASSGLLMVYESTSLWKNHPYFTFITPTGDIWSGTLAYSSGTFTVTASKHSPS